MGDDHVFIVAALSAVGEVIGAEADGIPIDDDDFVVHLAAAAVQAYVEAGIAQVLVLASLVAGGLLLIHHDLHDHALAGFVQHGGGQFVGGEGEGYAGDAGVGRVDQRTR